MFLNQACRGDLKVKPNAQPYVPTVSCDAYETGHHNDVDTIEIWGSPPNESAFRSDQGSVLFQFVCPELEENYEHLSLQKMMQNWSRKMNDYQVAVRTPSNGCMALVNTCSVPQGQLNKDLYFVQNPDELILKELDRNFQEILEKEQHRNRQLIRVIVKQYETKITNLNKDNEKLKSGYENLMRTHKSDQPRSTRVENPTKIQAQGLEPTKGFPTRHGITIFPGRPGPKVIYGQRRRDVVEHAYLLTESCGRAGLDHDGAIIHCGCHIHSNMKNYS